MSSPTSQFNIHFCRTVIMSLELSFSVFRFETEKEKKMRDGIQITFSHICLYEKMLMNRKIICTGLYCFLGQPEQQRIWPGLTQCGE